MNALTHLFLDESNHIPQSFLVSLIVFFCNYIIFAVKWLFISWAIREAPKYWNGYPIPSPVDLPNRGIKPGSPALQADSLATELSGKPSSVAQSCLILWDPMDFNMPGHPILPCLPKFLQTHVSWVNDAIQLFHPLLPTSPPAFNLSQHQGLLQWVSSSYQVAKLLELQLQHQFFQWIFRTDFP